MSEQIVGVLGAIRSRVSDRSYDQRSVEQRHLDRLLALSAAVSPLTGVPPRIALVSGVEHTGQVLTHFIGSYGLVLRPPHLLVGVLPEESSVARVDLGYVLEQVVLEATRLGLGTCWVTGTYDARRAGAAVDLAPVEVAAAVCALGYPDRGRFGRLHSRTVRLLARGHRRKPLTETVFSERWGKPWSPRSADATLTTILEHAMLAPSASNRQPWRFIVRAKDTVLAVVRHAPIDAGIVMAHFAIAASALGHNGRWQVRLGDEELSRECALPQSAVAVAAYAAD
jgi:nitroreductase